MWGSNTAMHQLSWQVLILVFHVRQSEVMIRDIVAAFKNLCTKPQTIDYPKSEIKKPPNFRGLIEYDESECIFCLKCEKICPPQAILFTPMSQEKKRVKNQKRYNYNPYLCIYCGECVRACPKPDLALWQSDRKPQPATTKDMIIQRWQEVQASKLNQQSV